MYEGSMTTRTIFFKTSYVIIHTCIQAALKLQQKAEKSKIPPQEMFLNQTDLYSQFDSQGIPTLDHTGQPLSKNSLKKIQKEYEVQKKIYEEYLSKNNAK